MKSTERGMSMELGELQMRTGHVPTPGQSDVTLAESLVHAPRGLWAALSLGCVALAATAFTVGLATSSWWLALPGVVMARAGLYGSVLALAPRPRSEVPAGSDVAALMSRVADLPVTASELARRLGWEQARTLRVVAFLVRSGRLAEELDMDDGTWMYSRARKQLPFKDTQTAADQLRAIETREENS